MLILHHNCLLNNIILKHFGTFMGPDLLQSVLAISVRLFEPVKLSSTFMQHSLMACILNLTLIFQGTECNCQKSFYLSPLTTIRKMELYL